MLRLLEFNKALNLYIYMLKLMYHSKLMEKKLNNHQKLEFIYDF